MHSTLDTYVRCVHVCMYVLHKVCKVCACMYVLHIGTSPPIATTLSINIWAVYIKEYSEAGDSQLAVA